jgi:curved DNA-binding protein CbpA
MDPTASGSFGGDEEFEEFENFEEFELDEEAVGGTAPFFDDILSNPAIPRVPDAPESIDSRANPEDDGIQLRSDQRIAIDVASEGIENRTFYEILLLPSSADQRAIKGSYYKLSKEYHPDKFYRKELGPYKEKLEIIFNKVNEAYRVLSDEEGRADYDLLVFGKDGRDAASPTEATATVNFVPEAVKKKRAAIVAKKGMAARAAAGKKPRKGQKAKFLQDFQKQLATNIARGRKHMIMGEESMEKGGFSEAATHFQIAMTMDPRNKRAKVKFKRAQSTARNTRAEEHYVKAQEAMLSEDMKRAAEALQAAVDCKPTKGKYYNGFGKLISEHTLQQRVGLELLRKAVELEPRNVEYTLDLAKAYEELGMPSNAVRAYERVLHLDSKRSKAAKALKRLR